MLRKYFTVKQLRKTAETRPNKQNKMFCSKTKFIQMHHYNHITQSDTRCQFLKFQSKEESTKGWICNETMLNHAKYIIFPDPKVYNFKNK